MSDPLVCADCGHDTFEQVRTTRTEYTMQFDARAGWYETAEQVVDAGDMDEDDIRCADCGAEVTSEGDDLVTEQQYNDDTDD